MTQANHGSGDSATRFIQDAKRLAKLGAKYGAILALLCHLLPPHYRPVCDTLASLCGAGGS